MQKVQINKVIYGDAIQAQYNATNLSSSVPGDSVEVNYISNSTPRNLVGLFQFSGIDKSRTITSASLRLVTERAKSTDQVNIYGIKDDLFDVEKKSEIASTVKTLLGSTDASVVSFVPKAGTTAKTAKESVNGSGTADDPYTLLNQNCVYDAWVNTIDVTDLMNTASDGTLTIVLSTATATNKQYKFYTKGYVTGTAADFVMGLVDNTKTPIADATAEALVYPQLTVTYAEAGTESYTVNIGGVDHGVKTGQIVKATNTTAGIWKVNGEVVATGKTLIYTPSANDVVTFEEGTTSVICPTAIEGATFTTAKIEAGTYSVRVVSSDDTNYYVSTGSVTIDEAAQYKFTTDVTGTIEEVTLTK